MKLRSSLSRSIGGLILALASAHGSAGPMGLVELRGQLGFSCGTGSGGFENHCSGGENVERGTFSLVYDPLVADSDQGSNDGLFRGAIRSFVMTVSQVNRPHLAFSLVGPGDLHRQSSAYGGDWVSWGMTLQEENGAVDPSWFSFGMYRQTSADPNEMPTIDFWSTVTGFVGGGAGVNETDWLYPGSLSAQTVPRPVPVPGSLWLLLIGAAGAIFQRGSLRKT